MKSMKDKYNKQ